MVDRLVSADSDSGQLPDVVLSNLGTRFPTKTASYTKAESDGRFAPIGSTGGSAYDPTTQRLLSLLQGATRDTSLLVIGDSTGNETTEWVYLFEQALAAQWPAWSFDYRLWNETNQSYDAATTVQTGTGTRRFTLYNASVSGATSIYWQAARSGAAIYALNPDMVVVSLGHNEQAVLPELWYAKYLALTESVAAAFPQSDLMCIAQNPATGNTYQQERAALYREIAARRGYGFVDVQRAFLKTGNAAGLTQDGIHPTPAGSSLWAQTVMSHFIFKEDASVAAQPQTPLLDRGENLLLNADFTSITSSLPDNWSVTNATAAPDSTNFESAALDRKSSLQGASTALKFTGTGSGQPTMHQYVPAKRVAGRWVTAGMRVFVPAGQPETVARLGINGTGGFSTLHISTGEGQGAFRWIFVTRLIPANATGVRLQLFIDSAANGTGTCTVDRAFFVLGKMPHAA